MTKFNIKFSDPEGRILHSDYARRLSDLGPLELGHVIDVCADYGLHAVVLADSGKPLARVTPTGKCELVHETSVLYA